VVGVAIFLPYFCREDKSTNGFSGVHGFIVIAAAVIMIVPMWRHPMRKRLVGWIAAHMPA
jgi:hypothetical protein